VIIHDIMRKIEGIPAYRGRNDNGPYFYKIMNYATTLLIKYLNLSSDYEK